MTLEDQWRAVAAIFATPIACDASETSGLVILREVLDRSR